MQPIGAHWSKDEIGRIFAEYAEQVVRVVVQAPANGKLNSASSVVLFSAAKDSPVCVNQLVVMKGLARSCGPSSVLPFSPHLLPVVPPCVTSGFLQFHADV